jgi:hypothetical protein
LAPDAIESNQIYFESVRVLNTGLSLIESTLATVEELIEISLKQPERTNILERLSRPLLHGIVLPHGPDSAAILFPISLNEVIGQEPYTIVLKPIIVDELLSGNTSGLDEAREHYLNHHAEIIEQLMQRLPVMKAPDAETVLESAATLGNELSERTTPPWDGLFLRGATKLLRTTN